VTDGPALVPELEVSNLDRSLAVYLGVFGFQCQATRPEERFAYLIRGGVHLMLEEATGPGRRFHQTPLEYPYGRGVNFQICVPDVDALYAAVRESALEVRIAIEDRWYRQNAVEYGNRQFVVVDPDGYLLRFYGTLGTRPAS